MLPLSKRMLSLDSFVVMSGKHGICKIRHENDSSDKSDFSVGGRRGREGDKSNGELSDYEKQMLPTAGSEIALRPAWAGDFYTTIEGCILICGSNRVQGKTALGLERNFPNR